jgi:hypothetical protein
MDWANIVGISVVLLVFISIFPVLDSELGKEFNCQEREITYYRVVGTGGLFGGTKEVVTTKDKADGQKEICIEWKGLSSKLLERLR